MSARDNTTIQDSFEGRFLIAMPNMGDTRFEKSVVYICAHSEDGAMGFIVNKEVSSPDIREFFTQVGIVEEDELEKLKPSIEPLRLHSGGPVEPGRGFVLHSSDYRAESTLDISDGVCLTATLEILRAIATGKGPKQKLMALGYSGWSSGQLEEEIASNGWLTGPAESDIIFGDKTAQKYDMALMGMGVDPALLSTQAGHA